jgi:hypothetical protein
VVLPCFFERGAGGSASDAVHAGGRPIIRKSYKEKETDGPAADQEAGFGATSRTFRARVLERQCILVPQQAAKHGTTFSLAARA